MKIVLLKLSRITKKIQRKIPVVTILQVPFAMASAICTPICTHSPLRFPLPNYAPLYGIKWVSCLPVFP